MSRLKCDYRKVKHILEALGGLDTLEDVEAQVQALGLQSCPFCGGEAVVALGTQCGYSVAFIECSVCHNGTLHIPAAMDGRTMERTDIHDVVRAVSRRWSRRETTA